MFHAETLKLAQSPTFYSSFAARRFVDKKLAYRTQLGNANAGWEFFKTNILPRNTQLVPLWRAIEMDFDGLFGISDVEPSAVTLPALGEHLD